MQSLKKLKEIKLRINKMIRDLKEVLGKIEEKKNIIAIERDKLRDIYNDLVDTLESFDEGVRGLEDGKREIEDAIDSISEVV